MTSRTNAVRILFLFTAFLASATPSHAQAPQWQETCNSYCSGNVRIHECDFYDGGFGTIEDASSVCDWWECIGTVNCDGGTENAAVHYGNWCSTRALQQGDYNPWFGQWGCGGYDGTAEGSFYCSYTDNNNCP